MKTTYTPHDPGLVVTELTTTEYLASAGLAPLDYADRPGEPVTLTGDLP